MEVVVDIPFSSNAKSS